MEELFMRAKRKKVLSGILAAVMAFTYLPGSSAAAVNQQAAAPFSTILHF